MLKIYLTRHGETKWNLENRLQGWKDSDLTAKGLKNAYALGERLKNTPFHAIYSSPSNRALHTSKIIRSNREINIIEEDRLKEINFGQWEGKTKEEIILDFPEEFTAFWNTPHTYNHLPHDGESLEGLKDRVDAIFHQIVATYPDGNVLIVAHAVVIKVILAIVNNTPLSQLWESAFIHGASLSVIDVEDGNYKVKIWGDTTHLY